MPQTVEDLGKAVKAKYVGQYDDLPDAEVGRRVQAKFPGAYDDYADTSGQPAELSGLPHPDDVDRQTTIHARTLANLVTQPQIQPQAQQPQTWNRDLDSAYAPPVPAAPLPYELQSDDQHLASAPRFTNPRTGVSYPRQDPGKEGGPLGVLDMPLTGAARSVAGAERMAQPGLKNKAAGGSEVFRGGLEAATPFLLPAMAAAPVRSVLTAGSAMISQDAVEAGLKRMGLSPEYAAVAGDVAGIIAGVGTHEAMSPKARAAIRARVEPILKARAASAKTGADGAVVATVRTPAGTKARVRYRIDEAKDLTTSFDGGDYNANFQPRNTDRLASRQRVEQRKADMDPEAMGYSRMAGDGAPITSNKMAVTRNHGMQALKELYAENRPRAQEYRDWVAENAGLAGKTPEQVSAMKHPVLHRELTENWDDGQTAKFAQEANTSSTARMSDAEIAEQMARKLTGASMDAFHPNEDGVPNPEFVRGLIQDLPVEEQAMFFDKHGEISQSGARLVRNAVFAKAYPNRAAIERMSEATDSNVRNVTNGMLRSANHVAKMQEAIERGDLHPLSISADIGNAAGVIDDLRSSRRSVDDWLKQEHFDGRDPVQDELVRILSTEGRRPKVIADTIRNYVNGVERAGNPNQQSMFAADPPTKIELLKEAYDAARRTAEQDAAGRREQSSQGSLSVHQPGDAPQGFGADGRGDRGGGPEPERAPGSEATPANGPVSAEAAAESETGPHGPIYREYSGKPREAIAKLIREQRGEVPRVWHHPELGWIDLVWGNRAGGLDHIIAKHVEGQRDLDLDELAEMIPDMRVVRNDGRSASLESDSHKAAVRLDYDGKTKQWLVTAYEKPPAGGYPVVPDSPQSAPQGDSHPLSDGSSVPSVETESSKGKGGPVHLGAGLGAFEPFLRESIEEMKALKAKRDAAIEELERSKITPGEKKWGEQVLHFFTGERDLWAARANQAIAKARRLTIGSREKAGPRAGVDTDAEAVAIMREFRLRPWELKMYLDGTHPDLAGIEDPAEYTRVMDRIQQLRPVIARAMAPDAAMQAVDAFYTDMAARTAIEGKSTGALDTTWDPETYVPHVLNPRGEGEYPGLRKAVGKALGNKIGKYFGFSEHRTYRTLLDAIAHDVIPKTLNIHDAFTIQQDHFARARATRLLENELTGTNVGKYTVKGNEPEGWKALAAHTTEFRQLSSYPTGAVNEEGNDITDVAEKRLFVPEFIADALKPVTAPDYTPEILGVAPIRLFQAYTKAIQLGMSFFHAVTENYMALANMGPKGWAKALFSADRDSPEFLTAERDMIAHGGTSAIQGHTVEAYRAMQPGSIPTYADIWRKAPVVKQMDELAGAISEFTFGNVQRRFKVTDYQLHVAKWIAEHPTEAWGRDLKVAKQSIAKEINAVYGGMHWENLGINKATVEIARAIMLAPDWTISNLFNLKYSAERGTPAGSMARMFWIRTIVGGLAATQAASLMFTRGQHLSTRPTMVYMGRDRDGKDVYQNIFFKGASGDVTNLISNVYDYGLQGIARSMAGKAAPVVRTGLQIISNRDYLGHEIAPKGMNPVASTARTAWAATKSLAPVPFSFQNQKDMLFGPESRKYTWPERFTTMFAGNPPVHVAPPGTRITKSGLRPQRERRENSVLEQMESGKVYGSGR